MNQEELEKSVVELKEQLDRLELKVARILDRLGRFAIYNDQGTLKSFELA